MGLGTFTHVCLMLTTQSREFRRTGFTYLHSFWNWLDGMNLVLFMVFIILRVYSFFESTGAVFPVSFVFFLFFLFGIWDALVLPLYFYHNYCIHSQDTILALRSRRTEGQWPRQLRSFGVLGRPGKKCHFSGLPWGVSCFLIIITLSTCLILAALFSYIY